MTWRSASIPRHAQRGAWAALGAAAWLAMAPPAAAELAVAQDLARLRVELAQLRQIQPVQATPAARAQFEVRLAQLEEELRRLTGRVEQLEFGQRTIESRIDQLVQDLDLRLSTLERGGGPRSEAGPQGQTGETGSGADPSRAGAAPGEEPPPDSNQAPGQTAAQDFSTEGTLGQVPESALLDLPRPDPSAATPPRSGALPAQRQYDSAMELLRAGDYPSAERGLEVFLDLNPDHPLASNAAYWMAETFYVRKNYAAAASAFARNYQTYGKDAPKAPDNLLKLGMSLLGLGEADKACVSYDELAKTFPDAPTHIRQALGRERARADCS